MSAIMKKLKNGCHFFNIDRMEKFQITDPPKVWVSSFLSVNRNRISALAIMKKLKNGCHFFNIDCMEKIQTTDPPKAWVSSFLLIRKPEMQIFFFLNFPLVHFSPSPILGSISTFMHGYTKTFMRGHLCISGLPLESPMCSFTLPDIHIFHIQLTVVNYLIFRNQIASIFFIPIAFNIFTF